MRHDIALAGSGIVAMDAFDLGAINARGVLRGTGDVALKMHIGRRGIRYKDRATRLALAASRVAMRDAGLVDEGYEDLDDPRGAVVVASCFGNVDTVLRSAERIRAEGSAALSPMDLPNASANVIPATVAIWFGLRGANLLVANGSRSGADALLIACNLISAGRADRVLVCGVEAGQPLVTTLFDPDDVPPVDVAAAVVLERMDGSMDRPGTNALSVTTGIGDGSPRASLHVADEIDVECGAGAFPGTWAAQDILSLIAVNDARRPVTTA